MDDESPVLEHGDSHASSSHEVSLEPTPTRSVDLGTWNSAKLVKISLGIIARLHRIDQKQTGLLKGQCAE